LGYIESNLLPDEQIVYKANLHWKIFWKSSFIVLVGIFCLLVHAILAGAVTGIGLALALRAFIDYKSSEFGVTTKRVIIKVGFLRRRTLELLLRQVEAISVEQSVLGRMLDFGSLTLTGTGGVHEVFHNISSPPRIPQTNSWSSNVNSVEPHGQARGTFHYARGAKS